MQLYIHIPFCRSKCAYCAFYSLPAPRLEEYIPQYTTALLQEIKSWSLRLSPTPITSIFFGGGTPSLLPASTICTILEYIAQYFSMADTVEISLEANPESAIADSWLADVFRGGANRLSLGVQSFTPEMLRALGRKHTAEQAVAAYDLARTAGFTNVSLDLMWGLPFLAPGRHDSQTQLAAWLTTISTAAALQPEHISAYGLGVEEGTPYATKLAHGQLELPDDALSAAMYLEGVALLADHGYAQYEISNFAKADYQCQHNLGYWSEADYLGVGPAATSTVRAVRWTNPADITAWEKLLTAPASERDSYEELTPSILLQERLMLSLRTCAGVDLANWQQRSGQPFLEQFHTHVPELINQGLARCTDNFFSLTPKGMLLSNTIISNFFDFIT